MCKERWLPVVYNESCYQVSDCGRVKRMDKYGGAVVERILKPWQASKGYLMVTLYDGHNHKTNKRIHHLVARAFIGPPPDGKVEIRHLDGNPSNNNVKNLAWGTKTSAIKCGKS